MQIFTTLKPGNTRLVIFFAGWGMDEKCISHIASNDIDVIVLYDYRGDILLPDMDINNYKSVNIVAWSMGVWVADQLADQFSIKIDKMIAYCGSPYPVNDMYGIPVKIFDITLAGLKRTGIDKFFSRMLDEVSESSLKKPDREIMEQIIELSDLKNNSLRREVKNNKWNKVVIGMRDKIFPPNNLINYWEGKSSVVKADLPHYPFERYDSWEKILNI